VVTDWALFQQATPRLQPSAQQEAMVTPRELPKDTENRNSKSGEHRQIWVDLV